MKKSNDLKKFFSVERHKYSYKTYRQLDFIVAYKDEYDKFKKKYLFTSSGKKVLGCSLDFNVYIEDGETYIYRKYYCLKQNRMRKVVYRWKKNKLQSCRELN